MRRADEAKSLILVVILHYLYPGSTVKDVFGILCLQHLLFCFDVHLLSAEPLLVSALLASHHQAICADVKLFGVLRLAYALPQIVGTACLHAWLGWNQFVASFLDCLLPRGRHVLIFCGAVQWTGFHTRAPPKLKFLLLITPLSSVIL